MPHQGHCLIRHLSQMDCMAHEGQCPIRHFADNWVVAWGPGFRSDLALEWESFKAARSALGGVITAARAKDMAATYAAALPDLQAQLATFLVEGKLKVWLPYPCPILVYYGSHIVPWSFLVEGKLKVWLPWPAVAGWNTWQCFNDRFGVPLTWVVRPWQSLEIIGLSTEGVAVQRSCRAD